MQSQSGIATRNTKQKSAIRAAFVETDRPLSPEEVLSYAQRGSPDISIATVCRNLKTLVEEGGLFRFTCPVRVLDTSFPGRTIITTFAVTTVDGFTNSKGALQR